MNLEYPLLFSSPLFLVAETESDSKKQSDQREKFFKGNSCRDGALRQNLLNGGCVSVSDSLV